MDVGGWSTVIQAVIIAACTWYMRRGSVKDRENVKLNTSTPSDVARVEKELKSLKSEFEILRNAYFKNNPVKADDRGHSKGDAS
jgi:hypothetical protein